jgi:hypothetical protein
VRAFGWFLGENDLQTQLVDPDTGSCSDGLHPDRPNENKGAESLLSYLLGLVEIRQFKRTAAIDRTRLDAKFVRSTVNHHMAPRTSPGGPFVASSILEPSDFTSAPGSDPSRRQTF